MVSTKLGWDGKSYINSSTYGAPSWVEIKPARDVTLIDSMTDVDSTTREDAGNKTSVPGLRAVGIDFDIRKDRADASYLLLEAAYLARTSIDVMVLDNSRLVDGAEGVRYTGVVIEFGEGQPLDGMITRTVKIRPTPSTHVPEQMILVVSPSVPVIVSTAPLNIVKNVLYSYKITATGIPTPVFTVADEPAWLIFDGIDTLAGTPLVGDVGTSPTITVTATNTTGTDTQAFAIVVAAS